MKLLILIFIVLLIAFIIYGRETWDQYLFESEDFDLQENKK